MIVNLENIEATKNLAESLAKASNIGDCFALYGDLGTGKSTFSKYFIQYLNKDIKEVPSPTFTIMQQYEAQSCDILHVDCYRINDTRDIFEIGLLEMIPYAISLIEWPNIIEKYLPKNHKKLLFKIEGTDRIAELVDGL